MMLHEFVRGTVRGVTVHEGATGVATREVECRKANS